MSSNHSLTELRPSYTFHCPPITILSPSAFDKSVSSFSSASTDWHTTMPWVINARTASRNQIRHVNGCGASHSGVTNGTSRRRLPIPALPDLSFVFPVIASGKNCMATGGYAHANELSRDS